MKKQKEEAERYAQVQQQRKELQQRSYLIKLYAIERDVSALQAKMAEANEEAELAANRHTSSEEAVQAEEKRRAGLAKYRAPRAMRPARSMRRVASPRSSLAPRVCTCSAPPSVGASDLRPGVPSRG